MTADSMSAGTDVLRQTGLNDLSRTAVQSKSSRSRLGCHFTNASNIVSGWYCLFS